MRKLIFLLLCITTCRAAQAQQVALRLFNGSFEEFEANNGSVPNVLYLYDNSSYDTLFHWYGEGYAIVIQDGNCFDNDFYTDSPDTIIKPVMDNYFVQLVSVINYPPVANNAFPNYSIGGIGQKPKCGFKEGIRYKVSFYTCYDSTVNYQIVVNNTCELLKYDFLKPKLSVYLGDQSVGKNFFNWFDNTTDNHQIILNEYQPQYKIWEQITLEFIPDRDYEYIYFNNITSDFNVNNVTNLPSQNYGYVLLDAVSDIYYAEPTYSLPSSDTLEAGSCYTFEPYTIHPYATTHRWSVLGEPIFHVGPTPTVCPTETTTYVVLSNDNCGWAESDTITIVVVPKVEPPPVPQDYFNVFPNPGTQGQNLNISSSQSGSIRLFDAAGRLLGTFSFEAGESTINTQFAAGVYLYQARLENNQRKNGKYLVVK